MTNINAVQHALRDKGFDPGPLDGVLGPLTRRAIVAFQRAQGLVPDGIVGPRTRAALFGGSGGRPPVSEAVPLDMPWLIEAARLRGLREGAGAANNPVITGWAADLRLSRVYTGDDIAWCGLFVAHCVRTGLPEEPLPTNPLGARAWGAFGVPVAPQFGAVLVFWREDPKGWKGHVGFYWAEDATHYHVLGGNQSDAVTITRIERSRLLGARFPIAVPPRGITRTASPAGLLVSVNEA